MFITACNNAYVKLFTHTLPQVSIRQICAINIMIIVNYNNRLIKFQRRSSAKN